MPLGRYYRWCPYGCGKTVQYKVLEKNTRVLLCIKCHKKLQLPTKQKDNKTVKAFRCYATELEKRIKGE
jgi:DNA-directed RNA polymerase subunit RPC12/RpoP